MRRRRERGEEKCPSFKQELHPFPLCTGGRGGGRGLPIQRGGKKKKKKKKGVDLMFPKCTIRRCLERRLRVFSVQEEGKKRGWIDRRRLKEKGKEEGLSILIRCVG